MPLLSAFAHGAVALPANLWYRKDTDKVDTVLLFEKHVLWYLQILSCSVRTVYGIPKGAH